MMVAPQPCADGADSFCLVCLHRLVASMQLTATIIKCIVYLQNQPKKKTKKVAPQHFNGMICQRFLVSGLASMVRNARHLPVRMYVQDMKALPSAI